ncbi:hypothetical protein [Pedobacter flavus]|uniref:Uncharacterized protein n=1 Tax=Pedobacter flavus TaxID=3113906 RepID=A0ABU7GZE6_9SPHI|nr:hypothetical protein [Pedobacter sp. VNH31]MEE1884361.1 hypothetical protein [Pedobacter sp. VNH31]
MVESTLSPNFRFLTRFVELTETQLLAQEEKGYIPIYLEYLDPSQFESLVKLVTSKFTKLRLTEHIQNLVFLIVKKNEEIGNRHNVYWQNYYDDLTSKEVASFLLAYKSSNHKQLFQLVAKPITGSVAVKDPRIARWMCETIYEKIENKDFPLGVFGEKIIFDLFGEGWNSTTEISIERLKKTAGLKPRKPTVRVKKLYVELCLYIQQYLNEHKIIPVPEGKFLTDRQANFFFDILETMGYLDRLRIESDPKDYIYAMFKNNIKGLSY